MRHIHVCMWLALVLLDPVHNERFEIKKLKSREVTLLFKVTHMGKSSDGSSESVSHNLLTENMYIFCIQQGFIAHSQYCFKFWCFHSIPRTLRAGFLIKLFSFRKLIKQEAAVCGLILFPTLAADNDFSKKLVFMVVRTLTPSDQKT